MHKIFTGIFLFLTITLTAAPTTEKLNKALGSGDANTIAEYFGSSVDFSIPNNEGVYSKTQAKLILKTFFLKNKPTGFSVVHNGDSKNNSHYSIGNLTTTKGNFRTYILYKEVDKKVTILELKIEADE
ncbi:MAG: DUF4783 domain-containing protein [Vicingaceae bacterium]|nr:DUF4783 domain-containing protein [Vicingaceae bacterium]